MPDLVDPDPRIGIGCCFWQLGFKDDAKMAWERCLEINPNSKVANILLGLYYLDASGHVPVNSEEFLKLYKKAMTDYFLSRKAWDNADKLAHKAIQYTDVNAIASDGWYLLARKEHYSGNTERATDYYRRADDARGGTETGYLPAKFGVAQLSVLKNDLGEAKLRLEKMIQQSKNHEAMILLGTLYAEEVFANQVSDSKEDKSAELKKAITLLEGARNAWKDPKKTLAPDASVLLNLARLYETDHPDKALQCLQQVEQLELDQVPASESPEDVTDEAEIKAALRKSLPPQLLNNIGCFHSQAEKHELASDMFEAALSACIKIGEKDPDMDTDALVSTISFNLARSYESRGLTDKAIEVYEGLLARHDDYTDARARLAYIKLRKNPNKEGPDAVAKLYQENNTDLEVRALYGWYLGRVHSRKRPANINEDPEFRHYKHTLQNYDKHDRHALVGMGNLYLMQAREMRRESESEKQKRSATYGKAVEFFEKALSLDPKNAYAAQGIAIALVEDKKDYKSALGIFNKVRETLRDSHLYVNLGHIYAELRQYSKAIEHYEIALSRDGKANDPVILACLGRTWLNRGRTERDVDAYNRALECAQKALEVAPEQVHYKFNVAFVQIQLVTMIQGLPENKRSAEQLEKAAEGLEAAITSLDEIATHPQTPYPKHDVEQRANMARNTLPKREKKIKRKRKTAPRASGESKPRRSGGKKKKKGERQDDESEEEETQPKKRLRLGKKESQKFKSQELVYNSDDSDDDDALERAERNMEREETPLSEADERAVDDDKMDVDEEANQGAGDDDDDEELAPRQQHKRARRGRVVESDDEEEEEAPAPAKSASDDEDEEPRRADTSMADADDDEE
ncbi:hypothetical protein CEP52_003657 [Fusarium oligoseptatum]|uniref:Tetratricopeptide repeat protein 1 n=1 Tax=Fusarium oligoseptatum TaxID=2604345 RepID=A0A428U7Q9_9HYPO|nr:hypothetical protein CEP52_003657 [Fusarium oligoseptatum]